jgi:hypothetical protein
VTVTDKDGTSGSATFVVRVANAPAAVTIASPLNNSSFPRFTTVTLSANFTDAGKSDTHSCSISWGDGAVTTGTVTESGGSGKCTGTHSYSVSGKFILTVSIKDKNDPTSVGTASVTVNIV